MTRKRARITYSVITHESAESSDYAEHGFWLPGGWEHPLSDESGEHPEVLAEARAGEFDLTIGDAIRAAIGLGATHEVQFEYNGLSARSVDQAHDRAYFEKGEERYYTLHVKCSAGSAKRIARLLGA